MESVYISHFSHILKDIGHDVSKIIVQMKGIQSTKMMIIRNMLGHLEQKINDFILDDKNAASVASHTYPEVEVLDHFKPIKVGNLETQPLVRSTATWIPPNEKLYLLSSYPETMIDVTTQERPEKWATN